uniref:B box-type domain-containing protein n=2 Tax=Candidatus Berkiella aquae TaxID=295108 RepID=A0A0Q9YS69_9GAMM
MNCYNHHDTQAIGLCPACHKGNCRECGSKNDMFSCDKHACIAYAKKINEIINYSDSQIKSTNKIIKKSYITGMLSGLFLIVAGCQFYPDDFSLGLTFISFGVLFFGMPVYSLIAKGYRLDQKTAD